MAGNFWPSQPDCVGPGTRATTILTNLQRGNVPTQNISRVGANDIYQRAGQGDIHSQDLEEFLQDAGGDIDRRDMYGLTLLMWAAAYGQTPTVQFLINRGCSVNALGAESETCLHLAASNGSHDLVTVLLRSGCEVDAEDENCSTPLMFACINNHPHAVNELLINGADLTKRNLLGQSAFDLAVKHSSRSAQSVLENHMLAALGQPKV